ncbi:MAG: heme-copper oxidase subunit III [Burkholderiales bacterium]|nr:heme-copper oxidase subunit III [Phycisphaerae bacterium]
MPTRSQHVPKRAATIGMYLFLASLAMLFLASILGYVLIRVSGNGAAYGAVELPPTLFISTTLMLAASVTIHLAMSAIRREKREAFRTFLISTIIFAGLFVVVQTPAMVQLYRRHVVVTQQWQVEREAAAAISATQPAPIHRATNSPYDEYINQPRSVPFYALVMFLILIHALHVVGGIVALALVSYNAFHDRYDHEDYVGVRNCVLYWHFLDGVWIFMFVVVASFG